MSWAGPDYNRPVDHDLPPKDHSGAIAIIMFLSIVNALMLLYDTVAVHDAISFIHQLGG